MKPSEILQHTQGEGKIYLPNEIFRDLQSTITSSTHLAFAYSYYYLVNYIYRYNKYILSTKLTQQALKQILGFSATNKQIDYVIKKGGVLDTLGYTRTTTDYPIAYTLDHKNLPEFTTIQEWKREHPLEAKLVEEDRNFKIKYPVKAFFRSDTSEKDEHFDGTFYDAKRTHGINIDTFLRFMEDGELGTVGFYIYGYIVSLIGFRGGWVAISKEQLVKDTKLSNGTIATYTNKLLKEKLIKANRQNFYDNPKHLANEYMLP